MSARFEEIVHKHKDWVYTFAWYSLGSKEEAEDATQEVMMRLWNHVDSLREETIGPWLRKVTRNACIDLGRRRQAYAARVVASGEIEGLSQAVSHEPDPAAAAERSELQAQISSALAAVREPYRSAVILREIQDLSYEEIAATLQIPLNTAKSYIHRGRRMMRDQLKRCMTP
jgi:RNA polymerase sigma-70 factor, ECF subfamily